MKKLLTNVQTLDNSQIWFIEKSEPGPDLKLFEARFDFIKNPRNGITEKKVILSGGNAVNVIALTSANEIVLVQQYRFGTASYTLELPGGLVDPDESPIKAAERELEEETGYTCGEKLIPLGKIGQNPVFMDSYVHHFLALDVKLTKKQTLDAGENIEVILMPLEELKFRWQKGEIEHPHSVNALLRYFNSVNYGK
ncbi:MAG: NUDIX hydrolase [Saprospiraceae bacterium]|jgi:ADP-ribose pyrophosphatase|nr:NUDIX hydrolase [Saprospiraceae bacterium]MDP4699458.1 NUDIX hydrolase [Saprospiraceae bacterium]MDP4812317.1 NUDIX hydrolase [Saprospiraceae bacterium]MDP4815469.1 NUDIX hydrolase [Saprospiraceae bacterium]MDP4915251.1 NUDIX hydrolase [Saprospiraceae bacterium]